MVGHVKRMGDERYPKRPLAKPEPNRKKRGRPTITWLHGVFQSRMI